MTELPAIDTPREPVSDTYHGVEVVEEYRWLEDKGSAATREWTAAQDARARAYLDALPSRDAIRQRFEEILKVESTAYDSLSLGGSTYFALKTQPPLQQAFLVALDGLEDTAGERVVVDPNALDASGETTIDWYCPSPDGSLVAISLSEHGTEDGTVYVYDTATGETVDAPLRHVNSGMAGGSLAWRADSGGFWCTWTAAPGTVPDSDVGFYQEVWFHELGSSDDRRELAGVFAENRIAENFLSASPDGRWTMDLVQKGDGGEWQIFARRQQGDAGWRMVADLGDACIRAVFGGESLFVLSVRDAPRGQVLRLELDDAVTVADATVVVPQGELAIEEIVASDARLWAVDIDGGPSSIRVFDHDGNALPELSLPAISSIDGPCKLGAGAVAWAVETFVSPRSWWVHADDDAEPRRTALGTTTPVDSAGIEVERVFATSKDGTQVPINLLYRSGTSKDGSAPAVLYGYGGFAISLKPSFAPSRLLWLEQGGVYAVANLRGGGEYGREWHDAGRLAAKQNCFDDFAACADHLVRTGVTRRDRLGIMGGSNGGLLMGAVLTQRPEIAAAVVCAVPVLDMLRSELTPNGAFNVTEFGTVRDPELFRTLYAYSPYHNVLDGTAYPPVLFTAGEFDTRVEAHHAKKTVARLQAATSSDQPILLRMESGGHGIGQSLDQSVALVTDYYTFFFDRLHVPYHAKEA
ncbi:prolyl oligopeptidase family serine peptidase [Solirubrobacter ginsenosidimutans]|uniref:prolyl oligopeptidase n=1 Tax=Solirubrobacter ginsenosidimutans TaxID=490573 RepID=A0A9X3MQW4_9ACTN|nr:prolyl oligopeptidase family serine peptidase [Solirubrobacter ginsenosidimutans]MDA0160795.1 prolyl oligopeptidase family serine peptidase [Solirubrobacter ginsenosidimutans]